MKVHWMQIFGIDHVISKGDHWWEATVEYSPVLWDRGRIEDPVEDTIKDTMYWLTMASDDELGLRPLRVCTDIPALVDTMLGAYIQNAVCIIRHDDVTPADIFRRTLVFGEDDRLELLIRNRL